MTTLWRKKRGVTICQSRIQLRIVIINDIRRTLSNVFLSFPHVFETVAKMLKFSNTLYNTDDSQTRYGTVSTDKWYIYLENVTRLKHNIKLLWEENEKENEQKPLSSNSFNITRMSTSRDIDSAVSATHKFKFLRWIRVRIVPPLWYLTHSIQLICTT